MARDAITLAFLGDIMLGRLVSKAIARFGFAYPWGNVRSVLREADLVCGNLECALTSETEQWTDGTYKPFYFRGEPSTVETLLAGRLDLVSIANNHIGDFGVRGLLETVQTLDAAGIAHAGAGASLATARAPALIGARGYGIAVVSAADYPVAWAAGPATPGLNHVEISVHDEDLAPVTAALADARRTADLVICALHWGPNMRLRPPPLFQAYAQGVIESGADIVWGHSAHVVQGVEMYAGRLILYDTGDFIDDYAVDRELRNDLSAIFLVRAAPPVIEEVEMVPVRIDRCRVMLAEGADGEVILERITELSAELGTRVERSARGGVIRCPGRESNPHPLTEKGF